MKKITLIAFMGLFSIVHSVKAGVPDLSGYGYNPGSQTVSGASHIIRSVVSEITATLKDGNTYDFVIDDTERQNLANIGSVIGGFSNRNVTQLLKGNDFNLDRQGSTFTLSYQDLTATFQMKADDDLNDFVDLGSNAPSSPEEILEETLMEVQSNPGAFVNDPREFVSRLAKALVAAAAKPAAGAQPMTGNGPPPPPMPAAPKANRNAPPPGSLHANLLAQIQGGFKLNKVGDQPGGKKVLAGQDESPMAGFAAMAAARKAQMDANKKALEFIDITEDADKKAIIGGLSSSHSPRVTLTNRSSYVLKWVAGDRDRFISAMKTKTTEVFNQNIASNRSGWVTINKYKKGSKEGVSQVYDILIKQPKKDAVKLRFEMTSGARF